jgi:hypothetical protein
MSEQHPPHFVDLCPGIVALSPCQHISRWTRIPNTVLTSFNAEIAKMSHGSHSTGKHETVSDPFAAAGNSYSRRPSPILTTADRIRCLDEIRRLSEEIKFERARAGIRVPV